MYSTFHFSPPQEITNDVAEAIKKLLLENPLR